MSFASLASLSRSVIAATALTVIAGGAMAATQPFNPINASVSIDTTLLVANNITIGGAGNATFSAGTLTLPVSSVEVGTSGGPATINFGDADGFVLTTQFGTLTFKDFSFDAATNTLQGDLKGGGFLLGGIDFQDGGLLVATSAAGNLGTDPLTAVTSSAQARDVFLAASQFTLAPALSAYLSGVGLTPSLVPVGQIVLSVNVGTPPVPEPATYALAVAGLISVGVFARRKKV